MNMQKIRKCNRLPDSQRHKGIYVFDDDTFEGKLVKAGKLLEKEKELKAEAKQAAEALHLHTKTAIEGLTGPKP
jgi:hypothetical protein